MISVVIPLYNKAAFIEKAVSAVISQTFKNFEVIIINDGSTDASLEILSEFKDARLKIISTENKGAAAARNLGIQKAIHPYIALLDADDWWAPSYLEKMVGAINNYPTNKLFATGRTHVLPEKEVEYTNSCLPKKGGTGLVNHFRVISNNLPALHSSSVVFQKDYFLEKGGFNETMQHFEDHECWLRLTLEQPIVFVSKPLSYYNKTALESMSQCAVRSSDLHCYFETMLVIKEQLSGKEKRYFKKFYQRFVKWSYLKFAPTYSEKERLLLQETLNELLSKLEVKILDTLQEIDIAAIYQQAKKIRSSGR